MESHSTLPKTLFVGLASSAPCWYRCALPAKHLGEDWIGIAQPENYDEYVLYNGNIEEIPDYEDYEVIVLQQLHDPYWDKKIEAWQDKGIKVLYEIDDFVHGIHKNKDHMNKGAFNKKCIKRFQHTFSLCDGMICSTDFLSDQYKKYNPNQYVCKNGIDTERYKDILWPDREEHFVIGWAGGTGHDQAVGPWLIEIAKIIQLYENVHFASIGTNYGDVVNATFPGKGLTVPWVSVENLPYAYTNFDCYIAPSHESKYFKSKSNLRWLEGSAVGLPGVVDPEIYFDAKDEETALVASTPQDAADYLMELIQDPDMGKEIGARAQKEVQEKFDISNMVEAWATTLLDVVNKDK